MALYCPFCAIITFELIRVISPKFLPTIPPAIFAVLIVPDIVILLINPWLIAAIPPAIFFPFNSVSITTLLITPALLPNKLATSPSDL